MTLQLLFWLCMFLWLFLGIGIPAYRDRANPAAPWVAGGGVLLFLVIALLGWQVFGAAIHK